ncbi:MAG TPA: hypothetical protein PKW07_05865 [Syntrophorhabdaceae bacterium]|nr:hypothetical protein [Syntrophorhabdaceae bacterium]
MALDEPREGDEVFNENGVVFLINSELFNQAKPIIIDFVQSPMGSGFTVQSSLKKQDGCGSCSC